MTNYELLQKINIELSKIKTDRVTHQQIVTVLAEIEKLIEKEK